MADSPEHKRHEATITTADPLGTPQDGMRITVSSLNISPVQAEASPLTVENYEYFDGALLTVCVQYGDTYAIEGTAVMIGLGLAISAKHVFDSHRAALNEGDAVLLCIGVRGDGAIEVWHCYSMATTADTDLQLLSLKLASKLPADSDFTTIPLTTRIPPPGEHLTVVGFRFERSASADSIHNPVALSGLMTYRKAPLGNSVFRDMILLWRRVRRSKFSAAPLAE